MNIYKAKIESCELDHPEYCIVVAENYGEAAVKVVDFYGDEEILSFKIECVDVELTTVSKDIYKELGTC